MTSTRTTVERNELVEDAIPLVQAIAFHYVRERSILGLCDEVLSDAYLGLVQLAESYDPSLGEWRKYVRANIKRRIVDGLRQRTGRQHSPNYDLRRSLLLAEEVSFQPETAVPDLDLREVETSDAFLTVWRNLPDRTKRVVAWRMDGLSGQDIAGRLGVSESRVCQILAPVKVALERELVG